MKKTFLPIFLFIISCQLLMAQQKMYINSGNGVNLREGAGTNYKVVKAIPAGSQVKVISTDGEWAKVEYDNETGFVSQKLLTEDQPQNNRSSSQNKKNQNNRSLSSNSGSSNKGNSSKSNSSYDRNWGIGLRVGDPAGLSVKKYSGNNAWELNIGRTAYWGRYSYYDAFYDYDDYELYSKVEFHNHWVDRALGIQLHYLWQNDLNLDGLSGLQWYYGLGGQIKSIAVRYHYKYEDQWGNKHDNFYSTANFINLGLDGIIGLEYTFQTVPLSIFTDINLFVEVYRNLFNIHPQGGIGIRYNF